MQKVSPTKRSGRLYKLELPILRSGYPLHSPSPYRLWFAFRLPEVRVNYPVMGDRIDGHSLLRQAQEKFASTLGSPAIEPERELIQIVVQVLMTDCSLVGSHQPPFEQGDHKVNPWHQLRRSLLLLSL